MVINNNDPECRGRVQVFVPHIMPTLYENWNQEGEDITINCVGDNMPQGLSTPIVDKLKKILPWAEAASPIVGQGISGNVITSSAVNSTTGAVRESLQLDQTPTAATPGAPSSAGSFSSTVCNLPIEPGVDTKNLKPGFIQRLNSLYQEATSLGYKITCSSGYRSFEKQQKLYNDDLKAHGGVPSGYVAKPGGSTHELGIAVDIKVEGNGVSISKISGAAEKNGTNRDTPEWRALLAKHGLHQPLHPKNVPTPSALESWHVEPIETPKAKQGDRVTVPRAVAEKLSAPVSPNAGETTSSSQFPPLANPVERKNPSNTDTAEPTDSKTGKTPVVIPSSTASPDINQQSQATSADLNGAPNKLAKDRIAYFRAELQDPQLLDRLEYLFFYQENTTKRVECGAIIFETAVNRAYFLGKTLKEIVFTAAYYAHNGMSTRPHTELTKEMIRRVIYNGQNETDLATDNASNEKGNPVAGKRVRAGCTGSWFNLKTGQKITDSAEITRLTDANDGSKEFLYRADGGGGYATSAGKKAGVYAKQYNIEPTSPSTFKANTPLPPEIAAARKSELTGNETGASPVAAIVNNTDKHGPTIVKNTNDSAKGLFAFPGVGAMVWIFFREGNPLFPVYFAASYSSSEWKSAYNATLLNPEGTNQGSIGTQAANSMKLNPNAGGGLEFTHIKDASDPSGAGDKAVAMIYGDDGSNMVFCKGYHQIYSRHNRRDQIDGHSYSIIHGSEEKWVEEDSSINIRGNVIIKIGKVDGEAIEAMKELSDFSKQLNETLMTNSSK